MTDIGNNPILNLHLADDETNFDKIESLNLKLKTICKSSTHDIEILVNNLFECDEKLNRNSINDYYSADNFMQQPNLVDLNNQNTNQTSLSNRYINCTEWNEGLNPWQQTHPYPYYINYINLLNRKRNRRFDIEFDESLGLFVPNADNIPAATNENYQQRPPNPTNNIITSAPGYMREITRNAAQANNNRTNCHANIIYDRSFATTHSATKRASSAQQNIRQQQQQQQQQPNNSLEVFSNDQTKQQYQPITSIAQPHIYPQHSNISNNMNKQQQNILYNTLVSNSMNKLVTNDDQPQNLKREKSGHSDFEKNNSNNTRSYSTQDKIDKIRKTFNAIVNKNQSKSRIEFQNARLNVDDFTVYEEVNNRSYLNVVEPSQLQIKTTSMTTKADSDNYRQPISQIEAQISSKTSTGLYINTTAGNSSCLTLDGEALTNNNSDKNSDYILMSKRKQDEFNSLENTRTRIKNQPLRHRATSNNLTNDLSIYTSSNQMSDSTLLPPIISGKKINLPHGPHR
jgi:hypothetical protein